MKVEAKDIPIIQSFMTEYWKAIKEFYSAELTDEYSSKVYDTCTELGELAGTCPDENDKQFLLDNIRAFHRLLNSKQRGMRKKCTNRSIKKVSRSTKTYICTSAGISKNIGTRRPIKRLLMVSVYQTPRCFVTWTCCEQMG